MAKKKKHSDRKLVVNVGIGVGIFLLFVLWLGFQYKKSIIKELKQKTSSEAVYNPVINPEEFTTKIDNKYFSLPIGSKFIYEGQTADGLERIEISIPGETTEVMGVTTLHYRDTVWVDGILHEDTTDYLAQNIKTGDVWYFGEDVDNYVDGAIADHHGAWLAGINGAKPGIWMTANPQKGMDYRQEYYKDQAEDMFTVVALKADVRTKLNKYKDCLKVLDWTPLEPNAKEHKFYCPEVGNTVLIKDLSTNERIELIEFIKGSN